MRLADALQVKRGDVVAFTGAGGKTSALVRLARELAADGWRVLVTTTTRVAFDELTLFPASCSHETTGHALALRLEAERCVFWYSRVEGEKVHGIDADHVPELLRDTNADVLLIEADGSRRLPIKAPYTHEPVVPSAATLVVNVVGFSAFGQPLDDEHVYNARGLASAADVRVGAFIDSNVMSLALITGAQNVGTLRFVALLNVVPPSVDQNARRIARLTLVSSLVERVLIGAVQEDDPIQEVRRRVCAIVLAAGLSTRMGRQKVLLPWGDGVVLAQVLRQLRSAELDYVLVVTGANADAVGAVARQGFSLSVHNPDYATREMLSSLQTGLSAALNTAATAALVVLGDQPSIQHRNVRAVLDAYAEGSGTIIAPSHAMKRGHPILIDRVYWDEILALPPSGAPRDVINRHADAIAYVETDDSVLRDIDTQEAYTEEYRRAFGTDPRIE